MRGLLRVLRLKGILWIENVGWGCCWVPLGFIGWSWILIGPKKKGHPTGFGEMALDASGKGQPRADLGVR